MTTGCDLVATRLGQRLAAMKSVRVVFAESCTGGMAAALVTQIPGISDYFCGSAVTYRVDTKLRWLNVSPQIVATHTPESLESSLALAVNVLAATPEATVSAAITGHLGPGISECLDGIVYVAMAKRTNDEFAEIGTFAYRLKTSDRVSRQVEAARWMLSQLTDVLNSECQ